jgi:NAD(P)-dependent dehydrogenase (short-subunit alcohol dehydrogenase family)
MKENSEARTEAVQAVVDRVSSYQDGAPEGTVETELRKGLGDAGLDLSDQEVTALAEAIESEHGSIDVGNVLAG